jgi:pyridoxine 5-phosphate synthase
MRTVCQTLVDAGIEVSLFVDPDIRQIDAAIKAGAPVIELHTGCYTDAENPQKQAVELARIKEASTYAYHAGLQVNAGHGLNIHNVDLICKIPEIVELNIGHSIIAQAVFSGLEQTVRDLKALMRDCRAEI